MAMVAQSRHLSSHNILLVGMLNTMLRHPAPRWVPCLTFSCTSITLASKLLGFVKRLILSWDLGEVLQVRAGSPFEPFPDASFCISPSGWRSSSPSPLSHSPVSPTQEIWPSVVLHTVTQNKVPELPSYFCIYKLFTLLFTAVLIKFILCCARNSYND